MYVSTFCGNLVYIQVYVNGREKFYIELQSKLRINYIFKILRVFVQKNCFCLQEYYVGDSEYLWKEDFLVQVMVYCSICFDLDLFSIVQVVFFIKVRQSIKEFSDDCREFKYFLIRFGGKIYKVLLFVIGNFFFILRYIVYFYVVFYCICILILLLNNLKIIEFFN